MRVTLVVLALLVFATAGLAVAPPSPQPGKEEALKQLRQLRDKQFNAEQQGYQNLLKKLEELRRKNENRAKLPPHFLRSDTPE